jgi:hypothetical protein
MITTKGTIQGKYAEEYGVGLAVTTTADLAEQLEEYDRTFDSARYEQQRNLLLNEFKQDYQRFKEIVTDFCCS